MAKAKKIITQDGRLYSEWLSFVLELRYITEFLVNLGCEALFPIEEKKAVAAADIMPEIRALVYWGIFDAQVSNGGVAQFYFNKAFTLPDFEKTAEIMRGHSMLSDAAELAEEALAGFNAHSVAVKKAIKSDKWPEKLFNDLAPDFENLEAKLFSTHKEINARLSYEILKNPHRYLDFSATPKWNPDFTGTLDFKIKPHSSTYKGSLNFINGFPYGPNKINTQFKFQTEDGWQKVNENKEIYISSDHSNIEITGKDAKDRKWINHNLQREETRRFSPEGNLLEVSTKNFSGVTVGEQFKLYDSGIIRDEELYDHKGTRLRSVRYFPSGKVYFESELTANDEFELERCYWPSGQLNYECLIIDSLNDVRKYTSAYDENGKQTILDGNGTLCSFYGIEDEITTTSTCSIVDGLLHGDKIDFENNEETYRREYIQGVPS